MTVLPLKEFHLFVFVYVCSCTFYSFNDLGDMMGIRPLVIYKDKKLCSLSGNAPLVLHLSFRTQNLFMVQV